MKVSLGNREIDLLLTAMVTLQGDWESGDAGQTADDEDRFDRVFRKLQDARNRLGSERYAQGDMDDLRKA